MNPSDATPLFTGSELRALIVAYLPELAALEADAYRHRDRITNDRQKVGKGQRDTAIALTHRWHRERLLQILKRADALELLLRIVAWEGMGATEADVRRMDDDALFDQLQIYGYGWVDGKWTAGANTHALDTGKEL